MGLLNRQALLAREQLQIEKVEFENGDFVYVRQMYGRERDNFEQSLFKEKKDAEGKVSGYENDTKDFRAKLAVCTVCDEKGVNIFEPNDYAILSQHMSAKRLETIVNKAQDMNKISEKDKENLTKNSKADQVGNSNSDSVGNSDTPTLTIS